MRALLLTLTTCLLVLPANAKYSGGTGEPNDPYQIATAADLNTVGAEPNDWDKHFVLVADIDLRGLRGASFNMIGEHGAYGRPFSGVFNGNGKTISNLTCNKAGATSFGLFAAVQGTSAVIKNLTLKGATVTAATQGIAGPLVGYLHSGKISRCHADGGSVSGAWAVGGLVGICSGTVINCSSSASVSTTDGSGGGLVGLNDGTVTQCYSTGSVSARSWAGGLVGESTNTVSDCYSTAKASASKGYAGGLVASNSGTIRNCYSTGAVSAPQGAGGLVGGTEGQQGVIDSFWNVRTSGQSTSVGGSGKTTAQMKTAATFTGWDFAGTWTIQEGVDYPRLRWEADPFPTPAATTIEKVSGDGQRALTGHNAPSLLTVRVTDQDGEPMAGVQVQFTVITGDGMVQPTSAVTEGIGLASITLIVGPTAGTIRVRAAAGGLSVDFDIQADSLPAAMTMEVVSGNYQSGRTGSKLALPLTVCVKDQIGEAMVDAQVRFTVLAGDGTVEPAVAVTNAAGLASTELTLGATAGSVRVTATVGTLSVDFSLIALGVTSIEIVSGNNQLGVVGSKLLFALVVRVRDQFGAGNADVEVRFTVVSGDGTVEPASAVTDSAGVASTELTLGPTAGSVRVTATAGALSMNFNIIALAAGYSGGRGTAEDPYQIATPADLIALGAMSADYGKHFILTADIDLDPNLPGRKVFDKAVIAPEGISAFAGVFDGKGHTISHLTIRGKNILGLFGQLGWANIAGAEVRDLGVINVNITGSGNYVGGLLALNCGTMTQCYSIGAVSGKIDIGGLAGYNLGSITNSYSNASVTGTDSVGGLVGVNGWDHYWGRQGSIVGSYSTGSVSGTEKVGGLVGENESSVASSFWDIQTSGQTQSAGGTGKTTAEMQTASTFLEAGWDFMGETANGTEDVWWIFEGRDHPRLWWQHGRASSPDPGYGAQDVSRLAILRWTGGGPEFCHDVYFGDDETVVANATSQTQGINRGRQAAETTTYDPGVLEWGKEYYWRIDEVNEGDPNSPWKGTVWSFTTADFIIVHVIDDFESYTDDVKAGGAIFQTWLDGWGYGDPNNPAGNPNTPPYYPGNGTGSYVGHDIWAPGTPYTTITETRITHGGKQSMPMAYNNANKPWYSEAERTWATPQDWTIESADTLTLYFRGEPNNSPDPLYVGIEDSGGRIAVVVHPDAEAVLASEWQKWHIALGEVRAAGVDVAAVQKMVIGVGDRKNAKPGGTGRIYIDDIRLTQRMP